MNDAFGEIDQETSVASEADMVAVRMFGEKHVIEEDGFRITLYRCKGKIYIDQLEKVSP